MTRFGPKSVTFGATTYTDHKALVQFAGALLAGNFAQFTRIEKVCNDQFMIIQELEFIICKFHIVT